MNSYISSFKKRADRKKLLKYIGYFCLFLLFVVLFDRSLYYLIFRMEEDFYSKNEFEQRFEKYMEGRSFSTLILGTSRAYEGIHPIYFDRLLGVKAFKETFRGKGPKYNYYFYKLYKKYAGVPKVVVYGIDYFVFNITSDLRWMARFNQEEAKEKIDFFAAPLLLVKNKPKIDNFYNNIMIRLKEKKDPEADADSFKDIIDIQKYMGINKPDKKINTRITPNYGRQPYPRYPGKEGKYFDKMLDEMIQDGVTIILVALPDYIGSYKTNYERGVFINHLKIQRRKSENVFIYNYNRPKRFPLSNTENFNDGGYGQTNSHLSRKGAELFCNLLIEEITRHYQ
jgi:hypothetical protein